VPRKRRRSVDPLAPFFPGDVIIRVEGERWVGRVVSVRPKKIVKGLPRYQVKVKPIHKARERSMHKANWSWADLWRKASPLEMLAAQG